VVHGFIFKRRRQVDDSAGQFHCLSFLLRRQVELQPFALLAFIRAVPGLNYSWYGCATKGDA
ncbi:MAG TPA: hypothetical protein VKB78_02775, partial [Pirellulales bacterium]|nr:hypothetical protein [Pirellulales bacterium]